MEVFKHSFALFSTYRLYASYREIDWSHRGVRYVRKRIHFSIHLRVHTCTHKAKNMRIVSWWVGEKIALVRFAQTVSHPLSSLTILRFPLFANLFLPALPFFFLLSGILFLFLSFSFSLSLSLFLFLHDLILLFSYELRSLSSMMKDKPSTRLKMRMRIFTIIRIRIKRLMKIQTNKKIKIYNLKIDLI